MFNQAPATVTKASRGMGGGSGGGAGGDAVSLGLMMQQKGKKKRGKVVLAYGQSEDVGGARTRTREKVLNPNALHSGKTTMRRSGKVRAPGLGKKKKVSTLKKTILRERKERWYVLHPEDRPAPPTEPEEAKVAAGAAGGAAGVAKREKGGPDLKKVNKKFRKFDTDEEGSIDGEDLQALARACGHTLTEEEAEDLAAELDEEGDGCIDKEAFVGWIKEQWYAQHPEDRPSDGEEENGVEAEEEGGKEGGGETRQLRQPMQPGQPGRRWEAAWASTWAN